MEEDLLAEMLEELGLDEFEIEQAQEDFNEEYNN